MGTGFLDTWSVVNEDGSIKTKVRCKETHTNQCNHPLEHKRGVVKTLMHRVDTTVSDERDEVDERSHMKQALTMNCYPEWLINSIPTIQPSLESTTSVSSDDVVRVKQSHHTRNPPVRNPQ